MTNIVLLESEMSSNIGNIGRTCITTQTRLHLVEPLDFKPNKKASRGAGLDYWDKLDATVYSDYQDFLERNSQARGSTYFTTAKARKMHFDMFYRPDCYLAFDRESTDIPKEILVDSKDYCTRIPTWGDVHSLNLPNSAAIMLCEASRQNGFGELELNGQFHHLRQEDEQTDKRINKKISETPPKRVDYITIIHAVPEAPSGGKLIVWPQTFPPSNPWKSEGISYQYW